MPTPRDIPIVSGGVSKKLSLALAALLALAGCMAAPAPPALPATQATQAPATAPATSAPTAPPTAAPPTAAPPTSAPTAAPPTAAVAPSATPAPTAVPRSSASYFVYPKADGSLWRADEPGQPAVQLADPTEPDATPAWAASPDGRTLAVVTGVGVWDYSYQYGNAPALALWLVDSDGSNRRKIQDLLPARVIDTTPGGEDVANLLPALTSQQQLAWSPDGGLVAFVSAHENQVDLYAAAIDGKVTRLTNTPGVEQGPRWSPDGTKIACRTASGFGTGAGWSDIGLAVSGRGGEPLLALAQGQLGAGAAAIPDLIWLGPDTLVVGLWDAAVGNAGVRAVTVSGGAVATVFAEPYSALGWSAATGQLAIAGASEAAIKLVKDRQLAPGLYTWMPSAPEAVRVIAGPVETLAWSAQGDVLAYSMAGSGAHPGVGLWSLLMDGDLKHLADTPTTYLRWSPDGQRLAAGAAVYARDGRKLADLDGRSALPAGWGAPGLYYHTLADDGQTRELWLWDGAAAQRLDTGLGRIEGAAVVDAKT